MDVKRRNIKQKANKIFTDREEPRKAFWDKYTEFSQEFGGNRISVLTYYGIGGIGKTRLLEKLIKEMHASLASPQYVYYDLGKENNAVMDVFLKKVKNILIRQYKFSFPTLELALYNYAYKNGDVIVERGTKSFLEEHPFLENIASIIEEIPVANLTVKLFKAADKGMYFARKVAEAYDDVLQEMEEKTAAEIHRDLPEYFALDMEMNMENAEQPLVIFLDTYEALVNEMEAGEALLRDLWIRGSDGLIQNIPGVFWVIAGREKLKWEAFDPDWNGSLHQHILGELSFLDATHFLEMAGITDAALRSELYTLTGGTPLYLDFCVETHLKIIEKGETPQIADFGKTPHELMERFLRYMDNAQKSIMYMLACLGQWTDELILKIGPCVQSSFSVLAYETIREFSFITQHDDGHYSIHKTVGEVLLKSHHTFIREQTAKEAVQYYYAKLNDTSIYDAAFSRYLKAWLHFAPMHYTDKMMLAFVYQAEIEEKLQALLNIGRFDDVLFAIEKNGDQEIYFQTIIMYIRALLAAGRSAEAYAHAKKEFERMGGEAKEVVYTDFYSVYADACFAVGENEQALPVYERILKNITEAFGEDSVFACRSRFPIIKVLTAMKRYTKAEENIQIVQEYLKDKEEKSVQLENLLLCESVGTLAAERGEYEKALEQFSLLYDAYKDTEDAVYERIICMANMGICLRKTGKEAEGKDMLQKAQTESVRIFGKSHPVTKDIEEKMVL